MSIEREIAKSIAANRGREGIGQNRSNGPANPNGQVSAGVADSFEAEKAARIARHPKGPESYAPSRGGK